MVLVHDGVAATALDQIAVTGYARSRDQQCDGEAAPEEDEPLQFDLWQWLSLQLATPVVLWAGWPFHRAAWLNLKHGAATMDTLISVGTLAAWGWSVVALFFLGAG